jgi:YidC/Oxa1 family membrane protein insertase
MIWLYQTILYQPIYNLLIFLYNIIPGHDLGLAIILLTILIKLILYPLSAKTIKSQKALSDLGPKMEALKAKYKDKKEQMGQELMKLYKENKINPLSSCLPLLIQLPFLIAVYQVFRHGLTDGSMDSLYSFISNPGTLNPISFGFIDLSQPNWYLAILTGIAQFIQTSMLSTKKAPKIAGSGAKDENLMSEMNKSMKYFMPIVTVIIGVSLPAGLTFYWLVTTVLTVVQQKFLLKKYGVTTLTAKATEIKEPNSDQK